MKIEIIIGALLSAILSTVFGVFAGILGSYFGLILVTGVISYYFIDDIEKGALYGVLVGVIAGIISTIAMITFEFVLGGEMSLSFMTFGISGIIIGIMINGIVCMVGGALGSLLKV